MMGKHRHPWQRRRMKVLITVAVLFAIMFGGVAVWRGYLSHRLAVEYAKIREAGYPITGAELALWHEGTPTTLEGAALYAQAFAAYSDWPTDRDVNTAYTEADGAFSSDGTLTEESLGLFRELLEANEEAILFLHEAATMGPTRTRLDFAETNLWELELSHLAKLRKGARLLRWEAILSAREGNTKKALRAIESMWWVGESMAFEPVLISQLVRLACHGMLFSAVDDILDHAELSEEQLLALSARLGGTEFRGGFVMSLAGERISAMEAFDDPYRLVLGGGQSDTRVSEQVWKGSSKYVDALISSTGIFETDRFAYLALMERVLKAAERDFHSAGPLWAGIKEDMENLSPLRNPVTLRLLPGFARVGQSFARADAYRHLEVIAFAIERFRLEEDMIPNVLDELVPRYLDSVPQDPFSGLPLKYRVSPKGYAVYSIGMNQIDDGGNRSERAFEGDIVLRVER